MPHVIGAIDSKYVECPVLTGSQYFNYQGFFSMVSLDICDTNLHCLTLVNMEAVKSGVLFNLLMGQMFEKLFEYSEKQSKGKCR